MKKTFIFILTMMVILINSCGYSGNYSNNNSTVATTSVTTPKIDESAIARYRSYFNEIGDEFSNSIVMMPKSAPSDRNSIASYAYFRVTNGYANDFRLVFQHYNIKDCLIIDELIYNFGDGNNWTIEPTDDKFNIDTKSGYYFTKFTCWADMQMGGAENFISQFATASIVKIKMIDSDGNSHIITLTNNEVADIKRAYLYYKAYGGQF